MPNNIYAKVEYPPCGFILQKDVYTTNLLYANNQFPLTSLKTQSTLSVKSIKKRSKSKKKEKYVEKSADDLKNKKNKEKKENIDWEYLFNELKQQYDDVSQRIYRSGRAPMA